MKIKCILCKKPIEIESSNSAFPFKECCCDECNLKKVIQTRYSLAKDYILIFKDNPAGLDIISANQIKKQKEDMMLHICQNLEVSSKDDIYIDFLTSGEDIDYVLLSNNFMHNTFNELWNRFAFCNKENMIIYGTCILMKLSQWREIVDYYEGGK